MVPEDLKSRMELKASRGIIPLFVYCFLSSFFVLLFCTKCSPIYPFQDGFDANCFFTVGKSILNGKVLYRDIYEHKGLYLYLLYALFGYTISHTSFAGIFVLEVICGSVFLFYVYRIILLYTEKPNYFLLPVFAALVYSSDAFSYGGQTEELALPFLAWGLYTFLAYRKGVYGKELPLRKVIAAGAFTAVLFWMKYTLTGLYLGLVLFMILQQLRRRNFVYLLRCAVSFLLGFVLLTLPVIIYFAVNGALGDLYEVYFYNLIFRYNERDIGMSRIEFSVRKFLLTMWRNKRFSLLAVFGGAAFLAQKKETESFWTKAGILFLGMCTVVPIYYSRQFNRYWGMALAVFAVFGLILCDRILLKVKKGLLKTAKEREEKRFFVVLTAIAALFISAVMGRFLSGNTYLLQYRKEEMPQFVFRDMIERESGTTAVRILNYGALDLGMYTALDVVPDCKYFCECNIDLPELYDTQDAYVAEGKGDYVICLSPIEDWADCYEEAACISFEMEWKGYMQYYYLYRHK